MLTLACFRRVEAPNARGVLCSPQCRVDMALRCFGGQVSLFLPDEGRPLRFIVEVSLLCFLVLIGRPTSAVPTRRRPSAFYGMPWVVVEIRFLCFVVFIENVSLIVFWTTSLESHTGRSKCFVAAHKPSVNSFLNNLLPNRAKICHGNSIAIAGH